MGACSSCCWDRSTMVEGGDDAYTRMRWAAGSLDKQSMLGFYVVWEPVGAVLQAFWTAKC